MHSRVDGALLARPDDTGQTEIEQAATGRDSEQGTAAAANLARPTALSTIEPGGPWARCDETPAHGLSRPDQTHKEMITFAADTPLRWASNPAWTASRPVPTTWDFGAATKRRFARALGRKSS